MRPHHAQQQQQQSAGRLLALAERRALEAMQPVRLKSREGFVSVETPPPGEPFAALTHCVDTRRQRSADSTLPNAVCRHPDPLFIAALLQLIYRWGSAASTLTASRRYRGGDGIGNSAATAPAWRVGRERRHGRQCGSGAWAMEGVARTGALAEAWAQQKMRASIGWGWEQREAEKAQTSRLVSRRWAPRARVRAGRKKRCTGEGA